MFWEEKDPGVLWRCALFTIVRTLDYLGIAKLTHLQKLFPLETALWDRMVFLACLWYFCYEFLYVYVCLLCFFPIIT